MVTLCHLYSVSTCGEVSYGPSLVEGRRNKHFYVPPEEIRTVDINQTS